MTLAWFGFPLLITCAVTGGILVAGLGFVGGMVAILIGNLVLMLYVGALSSLSARSGLNFALLASTTLGSTGGRIASGVMATTVVGWFAVQTGLTADSLNTAFGLNLALMSLVAGVLYMAVTMAGMRALAIVGAISAPLFIAFGIYAMVVAAQGTSVGEIVGYEGAGAAEAVTAGAALTMVVALFIDSGTMTGDITRWARGRREAWLATVSAFPIANGIAMTVGGVVTAAAGPDSNFFELITRSGGIVAAIAVVFLFVNLGNACVHCLYNAGVGWAQILDRRFRPVALAWGIFGTAVAVSGAWAHFDTWLILLGVVVPPLGTVLLTDHLLTRRSQPPAQAFALTGLPAYRWVPIAAWALGSGAALAANYLAPQLSVVAVGMAVTVVAQLGIGRLAPTSSGGLVTPTPSSVDVR